MRTGEFTENNKVTKKTYTVGSLFSGIGGFCKAFHNKGFRVAWANDMDTNAIKTYDVTTHFKCQRIAQVA